MLMDKTSAKILESGGAEVHVCAAEGVPLIAAPSLLLSWQPKGPGSALSEDVRTMGWAMLGRPFVGISPLVPRLSLYGPVGSSVLFSPRRGARHVPTDPRRLGDDASRNMKLHDLLQDPLGAKIKPSHSAIVAVLETLTICRTISRAERSTERKRAKISSNLA